MESSVDALSLVSDWKDPYGPPVVETHCGILVVRDDLLPAGSKIRFIDKLVQDMQQPELVSGGSNPVGWGPVSLAYACKRHGKTARCFWGKRKVLTPTQKKFVDLGGQITWTKAGMLSVTQAHAKKYCEECPESRTEIPFGLESETVLASIAKVARSLDFTPDVVWTVASSGVLSRGLQLAFPDSEFHIIETGHTLDHRQAGCAKKWKSPYKYNQKISKEDAPPFPSAPTCDAKAWPIIMKNANRDKCNLFWNVAP